MLWRSNKKGKPADSIMALEKFGEASGLFQEVNVNRFGKEASSPFEVVVKLGGSDLLVGNVGYGVSQVLPIILELIEKAVMITSQFNSQRCICILRRKQP